MRAGIYIVGSGDGSEGGFHFILPEYMSVNHIYSVPLEASGGHWIPWKWSFWTLVSHHVDTGHGT